MTSAVSSIVKEQLCLLPYRRNEQRSVKFVLLCGSELLGRYVNDPACKKYIEDVAGAYDPDLGEAAIDNAIDGVYDRHYQLQESQGRKLHHVETEIALLKTRVDWRERDSIILVQVNGQPHSSFPSFIIDKNNNARITLGLRSASLEMDRSTNAFLRRYKSLSPATEKFLKAQN